MDDNPYAPPSAEPEQDYTITETTAAGSRIELRPRQGFNGDFLRKISPRWRVQALQLLLVLPGALIASMLGFFSLPLSLLALFLTILTVVLFLAFPLRAYLENMPARFDLVDSLGHAGEATEISFEPRLPCAQDELRDTADDIGSFRLDDDGIHFHGDHGDCEVRNCDLRSVRWWWRGGITPSVKLDFCDEISHNRVNIYSLHDGLLSTFRSRASARKLAADIQARLQ
jgi:hypothetical protein